MCYAGLPQTIKYADVAALLCAAGGRYSGAAWCAAVYIFKAALPAAENIGHRKPDTGTI